MRHAVPTKLRAAGTLRRALATADGTCGAGTVIVPAPHPLLASAVD